MRMEKTKGEGMTLLADTDVDRALLEVMAHAPESVRIEVSEFNGTARVEMRVDLPAALVTIPYNPDEPLELPPGHGSQCRGGNCD